MTGADQTHESTIDALAGIVNTAGVRVTVDVIGATSIAQTLHTALSDADAHVLTVGPSQAAWTAQDIRTRIIAVTAQASERLSHLIVTNVDTLRVDGADMLLRTLEDPGGRWAVWLIHPAGTVLPDALRGRAAHTYVDRHASDSQQLLDLMGAHRHRRVPSDDAAVTRLGSLTSPAEAFTDAVYVCTGSTEAKKLTPASRAGLRMMLRAYARANVAGEAVNVADDRHARARIVVWQRTDAWLGANLPVAPVWAQAIADLSTLYTDTGSPIRAAAQATGS